MWGREVKLIEDETFLPVCNTLDNHMKELSKNGIVALRKQVDTISKEIESKMWANGILGSKDPKQLIHTIVYMLGLHFALWAGVEHRALRVGNKSQISVEFDGQLGLMVPPIL